MAQWGQRNRELLAVRAFKLGMTPVVVALLLATSWILAASNGGGRGDWPLWLLALGSCLVIWRTACTCCGCWPWAHSWAHPASFRSTRCGNGMAY